MATFTSSSPVDDDDAPSGKPYVLVALLIYSQTSVTQYTNLTLSLPIPPRLYTLPYWSNLPFLISDIRALLALRTERQSARMSEIKNGGLDQYGAEPFEQQQFGTAAWR